MNGGLLFSPSSHDPAFAWQSRGSETGVGGGVRCGGTELGIGGGGGRDGEGRVGGGHLVKLTSAQLNSQQQMSDIENAGL